EKARSHVDVTLGVGVTPGEEFVPVTARRLVRADLGRDDREVELDSDARERGVEKVTVRIREDGEPPTQGASLPERLRHYREGFPARQRATQGVLLCGGSPETSERDGHNLAIAASLVLPLDLRSEVVVGIQELANTRGADQTLGLTPDAGGPIDQRPAAVDRCPAPH